MGFSKRVVNIFLKLWPFTHLVKKLSPYTPFKQLFSPFIHRRIFEATFIPINQDIIIPPGTVVPYALLEELMRKSPVRFRLDHCICRNQEGCANYPVELGCIFLGEGAASIHPSMGERIDVEEGLRHLQRAGELGLVALVGHLWVDALSLGVLHKFKGFTVLCFCCDCCCLLRTDMKGASPEFQRAIRRLEGIQVKVSEKCTGCGTCMRGCFMGAIRIEGGKAVHDEILCKACGRCAISCPQGAVTVEFDREETMLLELFGAVEATSNLWQPPDR
jgi:ferredoxin